MKQIKRILMYLVFNGIFAATLYYGLVEKVEGALNVGIFIAWITGLTGITMMIALTKPKELSKTLYEADWKPSMPMIFDATFDACMIGLLIWHDYYWVTSFYILHVFAAYEIRKLMKNTTYTILMEK